MIRLRGGPTLAAMALVGLALAPAAAPAVAGRALLLEVDGVISPPIADYVVHELGSASPDQLRLIIVRMNTPGDQSSRRALRAGLRADQLCRRCAGDLGVVLMVAEAHIGAFGALGVGGIAAFVIGSLMMFPAHTPGFALSTGVVAGAAIGGAALLLFVLDGRGDEARSAGPLDARITRSDRAHRQGGRFVPVARRSAMGYV
jgi:membrane-bound ClpP family serine protease